VVKEKTFCCVNLATILALSGKKTLLVSLDLRKPRLHLNFDIQNTKGISSFLIGKNSVEEIIASTNIPNLFIVPSGPVPPKPCRTHRNPRMEEFFKFVKTNFDYIILDTPPVAVVPDALAIARYADCSIFVIRQNFSHKDAIRLVNEIDEKQRMKRINLLINDIDRTGTYGYAYGYGYGYGYGYTAYGAGVGYYEEEDHPSPSFLRKFRKWIR